MRGLTISAHGGLEQLTVRDDLPVPPLVAPTDVRVRVHAAALNHLDLLVVAGLPGVTIVPPWVLGGDGAGIVADVGDAVSSVRPGDRVLLNPGISDRTCEYCLAGEQSLCVRYQLLGEHLPGTIADFVVVPEVNLRPVPDDTPWEVAAAFPLVSVTAWRMLVTRAAIQPREIVLIWGIGGGVAVAALQIAKLRGAQVWVTSGSDAKLERARALGADFTFNHDRDDVPRQVRAMTNKRGVDVVIDNVGAATWSKSLLALGKRGRLVTCGATTGPIVETDVRRLFWNQWTIMGSTMGNDAEFDAMLVAFQSGRITPPIDLVVGLDDSRKAFERLAAHEQFGKIVIRLAE